MDNAKPNERSLPAEGTVWSRRLEEPGALPGVGLTDKEAAWDKLYDRLRETPRRRTLPWLWTAAACLLLALIPAAFFLKEKRSHTREPKVVIQPKALIKPTPRPSMIPDTLARSSQLIAHSRVFPTSPPPNTLAHRSQLKARSSRLRAPGSQPIMAKVPVQPIQPVRNTLPGLILPPRPDLSKPPTATIQPAPPKKQPRVVHINELEPAQPASSMAGERLKPGRLQVRLTQPETFRPATTYNNDPIDHPIIPIRHTQNP